MPHEYAGQAAKGPLTGHELKAIRRKLGLNVVEFAAALGYTGNENTLSVRVRTYESGKRPIPPWIERLAVMYGLYGIPRDEWLDWQWLEPAEVTKLAEEEFWPCAKCDDRSRCRDCGRCLGQRYLPSSR